jgi:type IX secretion system PorP/SprF family membrane protein
MIMRFLNKIGVAFLFVCGSNIAFAQDIHFAQMEYAPLVLNPALAGANSALQGSVNYRTQWSAVATPYKTMAAAIDGRLNTSKKNRNGHLVGGLSAYNDQSGDAKVTSNSISIALGYHLILDPTSTLGIAIYTGLSLIHI